MCMELISTIPAPGKEQVGSSIITRGGGEISLALVIVMIISLLFFIPQGNLNMREQESFWPQIGIVLFLAFAIAHRVNIAVSLLIVFVTGMTIWRLTPEAWSIFNEMTKYAAFYLLVTMFYKQIAERLDFVCDLICGIALLNVAIQVTQWQGYRFMYDISFPGHYPGLFSNINEMGIFLSICFPLFFRKKALLGIPAIVLGILLAQSKAGLVTIVIISIAYLLFFVTMSKRWKVAVTAGAIIISLAGVVYLKDKPTLLLRTQANDRAIELINEKPRFGWGMGQGKYALALYLNANHLKREYVQYLHDKVLYKQDLKNAYIANRPTGALDFTIWDKLHNDPLQCAFEYGYIGLALFIVVFASHIYSFLKTKDRDTLIFLSLISIIITSFTFFTFQIGRFAFLAVFFMSMMQGKYLKERI